MHLVFVVHEQRAGVARVGDDDVHPRVRAPRQHLQQRDARGGAALNRDSRVRSCFRGAGRVREETPREARARTTTTDGGGASFSERRLRRRRAHLPVRGFHLPERVGAARLQDGAAAVRALVQERAEHVPLHVRRCRCVDVPVEHPEATREVAGLAVAVGRVVVVRRCWFAAHHRGLLAVSRARQGGVDVVLREEPVLVLQGCHLGGRGRGASGSVVGTSRTPLGRPRQLANSWKKRRARGLLSHPRRGNGAHLNRVGALAGPAPALEANHTVFARHGGPRIPTPGTLTPPTKRSAAACAP